MQVYDDFAMSPENFEVMAKEFSNSKNKVVGLKTNMYKVDQNDTKMLLSKIEYLRVLVENLKNHTSNLDALKVLEDVSEDIRNQIKFLSNIFSSVASTFENTEDDIKIFCNNLKLAINTSGEIVKLIVKIKDSDEGFELSLKLTQSINDFVDINNQLVSLFGECRYRKFAIYKK